MKAFKACLAGLALLGLSPAAMAAGGTMPLSEGDAPLPDWPFEGVFGKFDQASVQRGFQVYKGNKEVNIIKNTQNTSSRDH